MTIVIDDRKWRLYYKSGIDLALAIARVINYAPRVMLQIVASLTDNSGGIIYDHNVFIVQAAGVKLQLKMFYDIVLSSLPSIFLLGRDKLSQQCQMPNACHQQKLLQEGTLLRAYLIKLFMVVIGSIVL